TSGGDQRMFSDPNAVKQNGADADQTSGFDVASVKRYAVADRYFVLNDSGMRFGRNVDNTAVLYIRSRADTDEIHIAANDRPVPDARFRADLYVADNDGVLGNECRFVNYRPFFLKRFYHII